MENQHRKIKGYRELTQQEIDLMNEVKEEGGRLAALIEKCAKTDVALEHAHSAPPLMEQSKFADAVRWRAIAKTHFQEGLMALTRSVAKPDFF